MHVVRNSKNEQLTYVEYFPIYNLCFGHSVVTDKTPRAVIPTIRTCNGKFTEPVHIVI